MLTEEGRQEHFAALKPWLTGEPAGQTQADAARDLGLNAGAFKVAVHRLRQRFRHAVKQEIAHTLNDPAQVREELHHLMQALG